MQWTISNVVGAVGWITGLSCLKGGVPLPANAIIVSSQGQMVMGALLCASGAGVLLWANLRTQ